MPVQTKVGKKGKRPRKHRFTDPLVKARNNVRTEIKTAEKHMAKLLRLHTEGRKCVKDWKKVRDADNNVIYLDEGKSEAKTTKHTRLQGIRPEGKRHNGLKSHIQRLKNRLDELEGKRTPDAFSKKVLV